MSQRWFKTNRTLGPGRACGPSVWTNSAGVIFPLASTLQHSWPVSSPLAPRCQTCDSYGMGHCLDCGIEVQGSPMCGTCWHRRDSPGKPIRCVMAMFGCDSEVARHGQRCESCSAAIVDAVEIDDTADESAADEQALAMHELSAAAADCDFVGRI